MTRKECYDYIKSHDLKDDINNLAHRKFLKANFTNLTTNELVEFVNNHKNNKSKALRCAQKEINNMIETCCVDEGARRAIQAIAAFIKMKNIEKNFD